MQHHEPCSTSDQFLYTITNGVSQQLNLCNCVHAGIYHTNGPQVFPTSFRQSRDCITIPTIYSPLLHAIIISLTTLMLNWIEDNTSRPIAQFTQSIAFISSAPFPKVYPPWFTRRKNNSWQTPAGNHSNTPTTPMLRL